MQENMVVETNQGIISLSILLIAYDSPAPTRKTTFFSRSPALIWLNSSPGFVPWGQSMVGLRRLVTVMCWPSNGFPSTVLRSYHTASSTRLYAKICWGAPLKMPSSFVVILMAMPPVVGSVRSFSDQDLPDDHVSASSGWGPSEWKKEVTYPARRSASR
jgi:hypothetical protein